MVFKSNREDPHNPSHGVFHFQLQSFCKQLSYSNADEKIKQQTLSKRFKVPHGVFFPFMFTFSTSAVASFELFLTDFLLCSESMSVHLINHPAHTKQAGVSAALQEPTGIHRFMPAYGTKQRRVLFRERERGRE